MPNPQLLTDAAARWPDQAALRCPHLQLRRIRCPDRLHGAGSQRPACARARTSVVSAEHAALLPSFAIPASRRAVVVNYSPSMPARCWNTRSATATIDVIVDTLNFRR
jgi:hypothetical protein